MGAVRQKLSEQFSDPECRRLRTRFSPAAHVIEFSDKLFVFVRHRNSRQRRHGIKLGLLADNPVTPLPLSSNDRDQLGRRRSERFIADPVVHSCYRVMEGNGCKDKLPSAFQLRSDFLALERPALVRKVEKEILSPS